MKQLFKNVLLSKNQTVEDIQAGMVKALMADLWQYDAIINTLALPYSTGEACRKVFNFLKNKCVYKPEPETMQRILGPAALLHYCTTGIDCKNYSMFAAGCMLAHAKKYNTGAVVFFRFAGYQSEYLEHVFVVVKHGGKSWWIDPVLPQFDQRSPAPYIWENINLSKMALVKIGFVDPISATALSKAGVTPENLTYAITQVLQKGGVSPGFFEKFKFLNVLDNSTGKWKSRAAFLKDKTPNERIAFFIEAMQNGEPCERTVLQYPESYYHKRKSERGTPSDVGKVDAELLTLYNALVEEKYLQGANAVKCGAFDWGRDYVILPGGGNTRGFLASLMPDRSTTLPGATGAGNGPVTAQQAGFNLGGGLLLAGLVLAGVAMFGKKR